MSRNNSVSTTETASTYPSTRLNTTLSATSTARTSIFSSTSDKENRVISDFNPTLVLYIPPHGLGLAARGKKMSADLTIHDVTTYLPGFNHNTLTIPDTVQTKDIKNVVASRKWDATPPALISKRSSKFSSRSTIVLPQNDEYPDVAEFHVPWDVMKPSTITLQDLKENDEMEVWCGKEDRRAQLWRMGREMYVWRWTKAGDLVLEKESQEMGSHQIGAFLFKHSKLPSFGPLTTTGGTLILDERGLSRVVAVTSILIVLKRERQRRSVGGRTFQKESSKSWHGSM